MLTDEDIQRIIKANEAVFVTKEEFEERILDLRQDMSSLLNAVDKHLKRTESYFQETTIFGHRVDRIEKWIEKPLL